MSGGLVQREGLFVVLKYFMKVALVVEKIAVIKTHEFPQCFKKVSVLKVMRIQCCAKFQNEKSRLENVARTKYRGTKWEFSVMQDFKTKNHGDLLPSKISKQKVAGTK